ncbi:hypothetical protein OG488_24090 [Streptomyces sp. NBC_01460]|uniref:hypothetical protein n=1 Tax=Streptomyces sp. NBC_01460 TaxID=2903875 RepID=UPI002E37A3EA|nr:hypothetical protein [Streptomyces sp. NBC_01460]
MSIRRATDPRRAVAAASMVVVMALSVIACGGENGGGGGAESNATSSSPATAKPTDDGAGGQEDTAAGDNVDPNAKLAEIKGAKDMVLVINEVKRDSSGFVTVQGTMTNEGDEPVNPSGWSGSEPIIVQTNLNSVGGATLVDKTGKKRYYILRDTDGRCLCTAGISGVMPGKSLPVFMQFPAPPDTTTEVDFTLPTFATTSLKISG